VVPRGALPEEPALAELPADPVANEIASPRMGHIDASVEASQERDESVLADRSEAVGGADSGDWVREEIDRGQGNPSDKARPRRGS
jgi:hypothetical protein